VVPRPSRKKRTKRVTLLTSIDPRNIIDITDQEDTQSIADTPPTSSIPASSYSLRNRRAAQGKLVYDVKYHPMDDSIRPSQAAKRRSAHGEIQLFSDNTTDSCSVPAVSDEEEDEDNEETEQKVRSIKKGKKRARQQFQSPEPTRRSSRRTATPKISYNMSVHPQDRDLEESSADDSDGKATACGRQRKTSSHSVPAKSRTRQRDSETFVMHERTGVSSPIAISSESTNVDGDEPTYYDRAICERDERMTLVEERGRLHKASSVRSNNMLQVAWCESVLTA
jgi:hypothetical protein